MSTAVRALGGGTTDTSQWEAASEGSEEQRNVGGVGGGAGGGCRKEGFPVQKWEGASSERHTAQKRRMENTEHL